MVTKRKFMFIRLITYLEEEITETTEAGGFFYLTTELIVT